MGQYFKYLAIDKNNKAHSVHPWDFHNGSKLTEHSWIGNHYVDACYSTIHNNPCRVGWVGDYSTSECPSQLDEDEFLGFYHMAYSNTPAVDTAAPTKLIHISKDLKKGWLVNHSRKLVLNLVKYISDNTAFPNWDTSGSGWCLNPLPLLTACGNGCGSGDYEGTDMYAVGAWAFDEIEYTTKKPAGYEDVMYYFQEED